MSDEAGGVSVPKARDEGLVVERIENELLVYDRERDRAHCLNATAALVFGHCDGRHTVAELATKLSAETGRAVDEDVVGRAVKRLSDAHLLVEPVAGRVGADWSRRQVIRKMGIAGAGAAAALPIVKSIVAPTPARAQVQLSCLPQGSFSNPSIACAISLSTACDTTVPNLPPCCPGLTCKPDPNNPGICFCQP